MLARALGHGMRARVIQFVKSEDTVGEQLFFTSCEGVVWNHYGRGFLPRDPADPAMAEHCRAAEEGLQQAIAALGSSEYDFVLLDEVCFALSRKLFSGAALFDALRTVPTGKIVVMTGRDAPDALVDVADTVSEMRMVKHAFEKGIPACEGVEY